MATHSCEVCQQDVRTTGVEVSNVYDGILIWEGSCGYAWPRFPKGDPLHDKALKVLSGWDGPMIHDPLLPR